TAQDTGAGKPVHRRKGSCSSWKPWPERCCAESRGPFLLPSRSRRRESASTSSARSRRRPETARPPLMCGIAGILSLDGTAAVDEAVLVRMRDTMRHRGPDGAANYISPDRQIGLAHRRLSIIDLSASATQPMPNEDETVWVTFNGEIYNHVALRR